jgi:hypothetical protein
MINPGITTAHPTISEIAVAFQVTPAQIRAAAWLNRVRITEGRIAAEYIASLAFSLIRLGIRPEGCFPAPSDPKEALRPPRVTGRLSFRV